MNGHLALCVLQRAYPIILVVDSQERVVTQLALPATNLSDESEKVAAKMGDKHHLCAGHHDVILLAR